MRKVKLAAKTVSSRAGFIGQDANRGGEMREAAIGE
jgi:hypothetical protein